jgi:hypothetical protein
MLKTGIHVDDRDGLTDMTILHYACKSGARGIGNADLACGLVTFLLSIGADPYVRCRWTNMSAIHYATYFDAAPVVEVLLQATKGIGMHFFCESAVIQSQKDGRHKINAAILFWLHYCNLDMFFLWRLVMSNFSYLFLI